MAAYQAFLTESVLNNGNPRPGVVKVVGHVDETREDGSIVKEVADSVVYMKAFFSKNSLEIFQENFDESFNSPPDWSQALLFLNQYQVEFQPAHHPDNEEKRARFVLVVQRFGLYNLHEGFYSKIQPLDIMSDKNVQAKAVEMESLQGDIPAEGVDVAVSSQNCGDVSLSLLLDQLGENSLPASTPLSQWDEPNGQDTDSASPTGQAALDELLYTTLNVLNFVISSEQQAVLDAIPEWQENYIPPAAESVTESQPGATFSDSFDVVHQGPTLRPEHDSVVFTTAPQAHGKDMSTASLSSPSPGGPDVMHKEKGLKAVENDAQGNSISSQMVNTDSQAACVEVYNAATRSRDAEKSSDQAGIPQVGEVTEQPVADSSETSKTSVDSHFHLDVSLTISSPSCCEDTSMSEDVTSPSTDPANCGDGVAPQPTKADQTTHAGDESGAGDMEEIQQQKQNDASPTSSENLVGDYNRGHSDLPQSDIAHQPLTDSTDLTCQESCVVGTAVEDSGTSKTTYDASRSNYTATDSRSVVKSAAQSSTQDGTRDISVSSRHNKPGTRLRNEHSVHSAGSSSSNLERLVVAEVTLTSPADEDRHTDYSAPPMSLSPAEWYMPRNEELSFSVGFTCPASQGFSPTDMSLQDIIPGGSDFNGVDESHVRTDAQKSTCVEREVSVEVAGDTDGQNDSSVGKTKQSVRSTSPSTTQLTNRSKSSLSRKDDTKKAQAESSTDISSSQRPKAKKAQAKNTTKVIKRNSEQSITSYNQNHHLSESTETSPEHQIYLSTQNSSSDSHSPPLLSLSPIQRPSNHPDKRVERCVLQTDEEEHSRLARMENSYGGDALPQNEEVQAASVTDKGSVSPASRVFEHSDFAHPTDPESANASEVLVNYSGSDDVEDSFDGELLQQAGQERLRKTQEAHAGSSSETVVIPDSSQEDVVVISSSSEEADNRSAQPEVQTVTESGNLAKRHCRQDRDIPPTRKQASSSHTALDTIRGLILEVGETNKSKPRRTDASSTTGCGKDAVTQRGLQKRKLNSDTSNSMAKKICHVGKDSSARPQASKKQEHLQQLGQDESMTHVDTPATLDTANSSSECDLSEMEMITSERIRSPKVGRDINPVEKVSSTHKQNSYPRKQKSSPHKQKSKQKQSSDVNLDSEDLDSSVDMSSRQPTLSENERECSCNVPVSYLAVSARQVGSSCQPSSSATSVRNRECTCNVPMPHIAGAKQSSHNLSSHLKQALLSDSGITTTRKGKPVRINDVREGWLCASPSRSRAGQQSGNRKQPEVQSGTDGSSHSEERTNRLDGDSGTAERRQASRLTSEEQYSNSVTPGTSRQTKRQAAAERRDLLEDKVPTSKNPGTAHSAATQRQTGRNRQKRSNRGRFVSCLPSESQLPSSSTNDSPYHVQSPKKNKLSIRSTTSKASRNVSCVQENGDSVTAEASSTSSEQPHPGPSTSRANNPLTFKAVQGKTSLHRFQTSRTTHRQTESLAQEMEDLDVVEENHPETDRVLHSLRERMRGYNSYSAFQGHTARSEDPKQRSLRRLKLADDMLKKVEECLRRPCT